MRLTAGTRQLLLDHAVSAARRAADYIASSEPSQPDYKNEASLASQVVTKVDRHSQRLILDGLREATERFELAVLSEELDDDGQRFDKDWFWCIDPLDGTLFYLQGQPGYAVSIALVSRTGVPELGVVADPITGEIVSAARGLGAWASGGELRMSDAPRGDQLAVFVDRSFWDRDAGLRPALDQLATELGLRGADIRTAGGAVHNACSVLHEPPACYFKPPRPERGGGSLWDFAATACIVREAGGIVTDMSGRDLDLNRPDSTYMNHRGVLFASDETVATRLRSL